MAGPCLQRSRGRARYTHIAYPVLIGERIGAVVALEIVVRSACGRSRPLHAAFCQFLKALPQRRAFFTSLLHDEAGLAAVRHRHAHGIVISFNLTCCSAVIFLIVRAAPQPLAPDIAPTLRRHCTPQHRIDL